MLQQSIYDRVRKTLSTIYEQADTITTNVTVKAFLVSTELLVDEDDDSLPYVYYNMLFANTYKINQFDSDDNSLGNVLVSIKNVIVDGDIVKLTFDDDFHNNIPDDLHYITITFKKFRTPNTNQYEYMNQLIYNAMSQVNACLCRPNNEYYFSDVEKGAIYNLVCFFSLVANAVLTNNSSIILNDDNNTQIPNSVYLKRAKTGNSEIEFDSFDTSKSNTMGMAMDKITKYYLDCYKTIMSGLGCSIDSDGNYVIEYELPIMTYKCIN